MSQRPRASALPVQEKCPALLAILAAAAIAFGAGCHEVSPGKDPHALAGAVCPPSDLAACEDALIQTLELGDDAGPLARAYAEARAAKDPGDPFAAGVAALRAEKSKHVHDVAIGELRPFGRAKPGQLLVALAEAAGVETLAVARPGGSERVWAADPLAPWMAGLSPHVKDAAPLDPARDAAIEDALRAAFEAVRKTDYVAAAEHVDALEALLAKAPPFDAQTLRGRVAVSAIGLAAPRPLGEDTPDPPEEPKPGADETPYYDLLRVKTDRASAGAYKARRERLVAAAPEAVRPLFDRTWGTLDAGSSGCAELDPPSFEHRRDVGFLFLLAGSLLPAGARDPHGRVPLSAWYPRYEKALALVEREKVGFWAVSSLLVERGGGSSILPSGTETHKRVSALALAHARGLAALAKARPGRVGAGQLGFLLSPGGYLDPELGPEMSELSRMAATGSLAQATQAEDVLLAALVGVVVSTSMPGPIQSEHLTALAGAFTEKLKNELSKQTGWWVAAAYGADFAYRALTGLGPSPKSTVAQLARALESDPKIAQPSLAALTSALARYAELASDGSLGAPFLEAKDSPLPGRAAARASMQKALLGLAEGAEPDPQALADLTDLTDNAVATLAYAIGSAARGDAPARPSRPAKKGDKPPICSDPEDTAIDPKLGRALAKLADLRKKVLANKALRDDKTPFGRRARLLALLTSDAIDVARTYTAPSPKKAKPAPKSDSLDPDRKVAFFAERASADRTVREALASFGVDDTWAAGVASSYGLGRGFLAEGSAHFSGAGRKDLLALLNAASLFFSTGGDRMKLGELFVGLARAYTKPTEGAQGALLPGFITAAKGLYESGDPEQADMVLVASVIASAIDKQAPSQDAIRLAEEKGRPVAWLLSFMRTALPRKDGAASKDGAAAAAEPVGFKRGLSAFASSRCAVASSDAIADVAEQIRRFKAGDRKEARLALDALLSKEEGKLVVPHVSWVFKQQSQRRILNMMLDVDLAAPLVTGEGGFNVGMGFQSIEDESLSLDASVSSQDDKRTRTGTARYFVHALATTAVYHFLDGDAERGERTAARALGYLLNTSWLFEPNVTDPPGEFIKGATATFAILAQLAADSGRPLLAGALLSTVAGRFDRGASRPEELVGLFDDLDGPMAGIAQLEPVIARAKKTMGLLGGGFVCVGPKHDEAVLLKPTCDTYPQALALRFADSLAALPELSPAKGKTCEDFGALDAFLVPASGGKYDPDKLSRAVDRMLDAKKPFEAAFLLTRLRDPNHCSEAVLRDMRRAADGLAGPVTGAAGGDKREKKASGNFRADLLTAIVNCDAAAAPSALGDDLRDLRDEVRAIGDPAREIDLGVFAAVMAVRKGDPALAEVVAKQPDFLARHRDAGRYVLGAIFLDHLASALAEKPIDLAASEKDLALICGTKPPKELREVCDAIAGLRAEKSSLKEKKRLAEETLARTAGGR